MKPENEKILRTEFTALYPPYNPLYPRGPHNNEFHFEVGDGWFKIIYDLSEKLNTHCLKMNAAAAIANIAADQLDGERLVCAMQVKEKFGTLRFYLSSATDEMHRLVEETEAQSADTCEECGAPGKTRSGGWLRTLCDEHATNK